MNISFDYLADQMQTTRHAFTEEKFRSSRVESMENTIHFINFSSCPRAKRRITRICRSNKFSDWGGEKRSVGVAIKAIILSFFFFAKK